MTQEEKDLLFIDLCGRFSYGVMVSVQGGEFESYKYPYKLTAVSKFGLECFCKVYHPVYTPFGVPKVEDVKPYLRPMSSMTDEERKDWYRYSKVDYDCEFKPEPTLSLDHCHLSVDWLNKKGFDYRGLIPMGLALETPKDMYKTE